MQREKLKEFQNGLISKDVTEGVNNGEANQKKETTRSSSSSTTTQRVSSFSTTIIKSASVKSTIPTTEHATNNQKHTTVTSQKPCTTPTLPQQTLTAEQGWFFPLEMRQDVKQYRLQQSHKVNDETKCSFIVIFIVMSGVGLLLLLLLWCLVILHC